MNTISLFSLEQFRVLINELLKENNQLLLRNLRAVDAPQEPPLDLISLDEAIKIVGYTKKTVYSKVCRHEIPVVHKGRPLTFSRKELNHWIEAGRPNWADQQAQKYFNQ